MVVNQVRSCHHRKVTKEAGVAISVAALVTLAVAAAVVAVIAVVVGVVVVVIFVVVVVIRLHLQQPAALASSASQQ